MLNFAKLAGSGADVLLHDSNDRRLAIRMRVTGNHQDSSAVFAVNLRPRSIIASPPGPVHDHLSQRHRLELRCCKGGAHGLRHRRPRAHISDERGISSLLRRDPGSGRRRRDPHRLSRRARGHLGVHSTGSPCGYYHGARPRSWCCACRVCACLRALMSPVSSGNVRWRAVVAK